MPKDGPMTTHTSTPITRRALRPIHGGATRRPSLARAVGRVAEAYLEASADDRDRSPGVMAIRQTGLIRDLQH